MVRSVPVPPNPKIYHILHADRIPSVIADNHLWCDTRIASHPPVGTTIGMRSIKERRKQLTISSYSDLHVGDCVPFYFCPRSIMLYLLYRGDHPDLAYQGGQEPIVHLEADLSRVVDWADQNHRRWVFTLSNAGAYYFEDRNDLAYLSEIDWEAVHARDWRDHKEGKQAEFLLEQSFPWHLVERIGVINSQTYTRVVSMLAWATHKPPVEIKRDWYY